MVQREAILKGNITGVFFRYVTPGVIGMVGMSLYILADTYFIANGVGRLGLAALNIGLPAYNLIFGIGALLGMRVFHHKTLHRSFRYGIPAILILQILIPVGIAIWRLRAG